MGAGWVSGWVGGGGGGAGGSTTEALGFWGLPNAQNSRRSGDGPEQILKSKVFLKQGLEMSTEAMLAYVCDSFYGSTKTKHKVISGGISDRTCDA